MSEYVKVDTSWLLDGWDSDDSLVAELYDDGQLKRLVKLRDGKPLRELTLVQGAAQGRQTDHQGSGGSADWITHTDGYSESFDAWSDNSKPYRDPFEQFVRRSIAIVMGRKYKRP